MGIVTFQHRCFVRQMQCVPGLHMFFILSLLLVILVKGARNPATQPSKEINELKGGGEMETG